MDSELASLGAFDIVSLVIVGFFFLLGLIKGFTWQVLRIATILVGLALARSLAPSFKSYLGNTVSSLKDSQYTIYIAYFAIFAAVFIIGTIIAILLSKVLKKLRLRAYDSFFGGLVGLLTGAAVVVVIVLVLLSLLPEGELRNGIATSRTAQYSDWAIEKAKPFFPPELQQDVKETIDKALEELGQEREEQPPTEDSPTDEEG